MSKSEFLRIVRDGRAALEAAVASALPLDRPVNEEWTLRDVLAHVAAYDHAVLAALHQAAAGEEVRWAWRAYPDFDGFNAVSVAERRGQSSAAVLEEWRTTREQLLSELEAATDDPPPLGPLMWDPERGPLAWLTQHDREHAQLVTQAIATGGWKEGTWVSAYNLSLGVRSLGEVFGDEEVAQLYRHRPPYPQAVFDRLRQLLVAPHIVLDAGAGTGALARPMLAFAERIDAIEPSEAMVRVGQDLPGGADRRIRWMRARAEDALLQPPYGLVTCGTSLHWMDLDVVLPRFRDALAPGAVLAVIDTQNVHGAYFDDLLAVRRGYETEDHADAADLLRSLERAGRFAILGDERTAPESFEQSIEGYLANLHSTSTLARARLGAASQTLDQETRAVLRRHNIERLRYQVVGRIIWGRPT